METTLDALTKTSVPTDASVRADHFEATLHYLARLARRKVRVVTCGELLEEVTRALVTAPTDYTRLPAWLPIQSALRDGKPIVARVFGQADPVVCVYRAGTGNMMAGWWAGALRVEPISFFKCPPNDGGAQQ